MDTLNALFNNAALLLVLSIIYEFAGLLPIKYRHLQPYFSGVLIALICVAIMLNPFILQSGIIFDTRSVLISVTALIFGLTPTLITIIVAIIVRFIIGGTGTVMGIAVIISSAMIGLGWRRWVFNKTKKWLTFSIYIMSLIVHIIMLACMMLLPTSERINAINATALPVMLIYPIVTVILSMMLMRQKQLKSTQKQLKDSEERFKMLFEKAPLGYQSLDINGNIIDVNQKWCELLGYSKEEVIGKCFADFISLNNKSVFKTRFPIFKAQGNIHTELEMEHKNGSLIFIAFEGKIGLDENGEFKQTHYILKDITAQKEAEAALIESEKKYRNIAENMSDVVWQMDFNLNTTYVSPSVEKLFNETVEEHIKRSVTDKFSQQTIDMLMNILLEEMGKRKKT